MSHLDALYLRFGREARGFSRQFEDKLSVRAPAIHFRRDIAENNLPCLEAELGIYICGVNRAKTQAAGLQSTLAVDGGRRRIENCFEIHLREFAGDVVSFEQNGARGVGRKKI